MKYLFSILFLTFTLTLMAQTPFSIVNSKTDGEFSSQQVSLANPWFGAKLQYSLNDQAPLEDNFIFNTKVLYTPVVGDKFAIPIVGSAGLGSSNILNPESGINVGIYPFYFLKGDDDLKVILHGGIGYKVIVDGVEQGAEAPQQIRLVGGIELAFYGANKDLPTTLSVTPAYLYNTLSGAESTAALEIDGIIPIANGLGLLASGQIPFNKSFDGSFRFGVIVNGQL